MDDNSVALHVLLVPQGDSWVARCLQYDVTGQGRRLEDALESLEICIVGHVLTNLRYGREPFEGIPKAPPAVWDRFSRAKLLAEDRPLHMPLWSEIPNSLRESIPQAQLPRAGATEVRVY